MHYVNLGLIFVAVANLLAGIYVWSINRKNKINIYFSLAMVGVAFWGASEGFMFIAKTVDLVALFGKLTYAFGIFIALNFLLFSFYFPFQARRLNKVIILTPIIIFLVTIIFVFIPGLLIKQGVLANTIVANNDLLLNPIGFWLYMISFMFLFGWSFCNLIKKYFGSDGFIRQQLKYIISTSSIFFILATIFDLLVPYFKGEVLGWIGPYATLVMFFAIAYLIFFGGKRLYLR